MVGLRKREAQKRAAKERAEKLDEALKEYKEISENGGRRKEIRVSTTDPESRIMKQANGGFNPSYNAQIAVDRENKIIIDKYATKKQADTGEFEPMMESIKNRMGEVPGQVIADGGYNTYENIVTAAGEGIDLIAGDRGNNKRSELEYERRGITEEYKSEAFKYDGKANAMICPRGKILKYNGKENLTGLTNYMYRADIRECKECPSKKNCCPKSETNGRQVVRKEYEQAVIDFQEKMKTEEAKSTYKKRGADAEFVNAWLKDKFKLRQFRLRGLCKVNIELALAALAYNVMQWFRLRWLPSLE